MSKFIYPEDMDKECIPMCDFFNSIGLETESSCSGHNKTDFCIIFSDKVTYTDITTFLKRIATRKGYQLTSGSFSLWTRIHENHIYQNWMYQIPYDQTIGPPILYADDDLNYFRKHYLISRFKEVNVNIDDFFEGKIQFNELIEQFEKISNSEDLKKS